MAKNKKEKKGFIKEFKEFIAKGNVLDMAVGVVVGGAFTAIVTSVVENLLTPLIGLIMPDQNFKDWTVSGFGFGAVINAIITFLLTALVVFLVVKAVNSARAKAEAKKKKEEEAPAAPPEPSAEEKLLIEIRDLLKNK